MTTIAVEEKSLELRNRRWRTVMTILMSLQGSRQEREERTWLRKVILKTAEANVFVTLEGTPQGILHVKRMVEILRDEEFRAQLELLEEDQAATRLIESYNEGLPKMAQLVHAS